jgi:hypothetical protein
MDRVALAFSRLSACRREFADCVGAIPIACSYPGQEKDPVDLQKLLVDRSPF